MKHNLVRAWPYPKGIFTGSEVFPELLQACRDHVDVLNEVSLKGGKPNQTEKTWLKNNLEVIDRRLYYLFEYALEQYQGDLAKDKVNGKISFQRDQAEKLPLLSRKDLEKVISAVQMLDLELDDVFSHNEAIEMYDAMGEWAETLEAEMYVKVAKIGFAFQFSQLEALILGLLAKAMKPYNENEHKLYDR